MILNFCALLEADVNLLNEFKSGQISFHEFLIRISAEIRENLETTTNGLLETANYLRSINDLMGGSLYD